MKRSEMVQLIWEAINELEDGDHILKRIEEAGMVPPILRDKSFRLDKNGVMTYAVHEWEDEDKPAPEDYLAEKEWRNRYGYPDDDTD